MDRRQWPGGRCAHLGAVQPEALKEGFHFKKPFIDSVEQIDALRKVEKLRWRVGVNLQVVRTRVAVQHPYSMSHH